MCDCGTNKNYDRSLLVGMREISQYCRVSYMTIHRWIHEQGFPAGKLPSGHWATTELQIGAWLLARNPHWK
jgi:hypothetical protein